jgi:hypothetical protein
MTIELMGYRRPREGGCQEKSCGQTNSAAIRLLGRLIPLIDRQISAVRRRSGIRV